MSRQAGVRRWAMALPVAMAAGLMAIATAGPATAHGSVTDPPSRNVGCLDRWGGDHLNPQMAEEDPMCWEAFQTEPSAMWNWNGNYKDNVGGRHQEAVPSGELCGVGGAENGRYTVLDTPGPWTATPVPHQFELTLTDGAHHGADYIRFYISKPSYDPLTERLGWEDLDLVKTTGSYPTVEHYRADIDLTGYNGRAVLFTVWKASHADQVYYMCSDVIIGNGGGQPDPGPTPDPDPEPTPDPDPEPTPDPDPEPTPDPDPEPTPDPDPEPGNGECTATVTVVNSWPGGYQADVSVTAGSSGLNGWAVTVNGASIDQAWNGSASGNTISSAAWNGTVAAGQSTSVGFIGSGSPDGLTATCTG